MPKIKDLEKIIDDCSSMSFESEISAWSYALIKASDILKAQAATYFSADSQRKFLTFETVIGPKSEELKGISFSYAGAAGWCALNKKAVLIKNTKENPLFTGKVDYASGYSTKSIMVFPCFCGETLSGIAEFINPLGKESFEEEDFSFAFSLIAYISKLVYSSKLELTLKELSARADSAVNNLSGGFIGLDTEENIIFFNPKAQEILSINSEIGKNLSSSRLPEELKSALIKTLKEKIQIKRAEFFLEPSKKRIGYSTINLKTVDGEINGAGVIFQDITSL
ncbi:MAG: hypothetical protein GX447_08395 [Elusimicrobia bacterium]|nr:hypothetical protein [Elusimicrobiota bacterium]